MKYGSVKLCDLLPPPRRCILAHMHFLDMQGVSAFALPDLLHCLHAIDLRTPSGALLRGGAFKRRPPARGAPPSRGGPAVPGVSAIQSDACVYQAWRVADG